MKKKNVTVGMLAMASMCALAACGSAKEVETQATSAVATTEATPAQTESTTSKEEADKKVAEEMDALIEAIYVQERTEDTDAQIAAAKAAWDALTEEQKALVEEADYFALDTGDASLDDALNGDEIGEKEILVVSFGTSFNDSRVNDIGGIEKAIAESFPEYSVRRAFTSQIIINHIQARDGEVIDNMEQALERAVANGVKELVIQPTHLMHGAEYDEMVSQVEAYKDQFTKVVISEPLLGEVGADATTVNEDKKVVCEKALADTVKAAGFDSVAACKDGNVAIVVVGHGTSHTAKVTYSQLQAQVDELGYENVFVGTVEGEPEGTSCEDIVAKVKEAGYTKVVLRPFMVVAGDHAHNDIAGEEEDSWASQFKSNGLSSVECQFNGLGSIAEVQEVYIAHLKDALK
ncbi:MAG: sirohydrochlorin cobaltochelatase [Lachnospiraceae bacterium]|nr:sirohydrochlorin cobaltochelatase [Lachnospiraceae bacterium]